jgi:hypothetical protein
MTILGCAGHRRIPPLLLGAVATGIQAEIRRHTTRGFVGVCSLAVGADQLFARAVLDTGGHLHAVIPCRQYESTFADVELSAFLRLRDETVDVETLDYPEPSARAFLAAGRRVVDLCNVLVAAWDGREADGTGGTADAVEYARSRGVAVVNVWPHQS